MINGGLVGGMYLDGIVSAQPQTGELLVGKMLDHLEQPRIGTKEILPEVRSALDKVFLILSVGDLAHAADQQPIAIGLNQRIPIAAPDELDHIPSGAPENRFQLLNNFAVATNRTVQPLQVAVDDKNQVVEPLARGQRDGAEGFGLLPFAVAHIAPNLASGRRLQSAILEILDKARVI